MSYVFLSFPSCFVTLPPPPHPQFYHSVTSSSNPESDRNSLPLKTFLVIPQCSWWTELFIWGLQEAYVPSPSSTAHRAKTENSKLKHLLEAKCGSPWHYERLEVETRYHSKFQAIYWDPVSKQSEKKGNDKIIQNGPIARPAGCYASTFLLKESVHWLEPSSTRWHD